MTPEGKVKAQITKLLKVHGVWYFMPIGGPYSSKGVPDYIACVRGRMVGIEAKAKGKKPTTLQTLCHREIIKSGGVVLVIDGDEGLRDLEVILCEY